MRNTDHKLTIESIAQWLQPELAGNEEIVNLDQFLIWPPDLFALTSRILSITGAYTHVVTPPTYKAWPPVEFPRGDQDKNSTWSDQMTLAGQQWRQNIEKALGDFPCFEAYFKALGNRQAREIEVARLSAQNLLPSQLVYYWKEFNNVHQIESKYNIEAFWELFDRECDMHSETCRLSMPVCMHCHIWNAFEALMSLHAIADEACAGWGIRSHNTMNLNHTAESCKSQAQQYAERLLETKGTMATLYPRRGRVLPKRHTPGVGITLRSLSANLSFHHSSVEVGWCVNSGKKNHLIDKFSGKENINKTFKNQPRNDHALAVLLFPWPFDIHSRDFKPVDNNNINIHRKETGFFTYDPDEKDGIADFSQTLNDAIKAAKKEVEKVDLVILPEGSLDKKEFSAFLRILEAEKIPAYIVGKRERKPNNEFYENIVAFNMATTNEAGNYIFDESCEIKQGKHHRWKLDTQQVVKYGLGNMLSPNNSWWEAINIRRRVVNFINIGEEITICPLICEDLARQDPIADLIRTVAPSLVVTILMDGPQKLERWPAKYASVLAEDPGCAVITLTSYGMVERCQQTHGLVSRSIALISDCKGKATEIEMQENSKGVLICLCLSPEHENLADGRIEYGYTNNLIVGNKYHLK